MNSTISISAEIPELLHEGLQQFLNEHPDWDADRAIAAAVSLLLIQNGECNCAATEASSTAVVDHSL